MKLSEIKIKVQAVGPNGEVLFNHNWSFSEDVDSQTLEDRVAIFLRGLREVPEFVVWGLKECVSESLDPELLQSAIETIRKI